MRSHVYFLTNAAHYCIWSFFFHILFRAAVSDCLVFATLRNSLWIQTWWDKSGCEFYLSCFKHFFFVFHFYSHIHFDGISSLFACIFIIIIFFYLVFTFINVDIFDDEKPLGAVLEHKIFVSCICIFCQHLHIYICTYYVHIVFMYIFLFYSIDSIISNLIFFTRSLSHSLFFTLLLDVFIIFATDELVNIDKDIQFEVEQHWTNVKHFGGATSVEAFFHLSHSFLVFFFYLRDNK